MRLFGWFANHLAKLDIKTTTTSQFIVIEKKHDLSMLIVKNLSLVIAISFLRRIERYI